MATRINFRFSRFLYLCLIVILFFTGCDSLNPEDPVELDFRGEWFLIAQHQVESELNIRYSFVLKENVDHDFTASASQYALETPLWDNPIEVSGRIMFGVNTLRLEFNYPESGVGPEVVEATFSRVRIDASLVVVSGEHYNGEAVGLLIPRGGVIPYETDIVIIEQIQ